jgi:malate dehydrogenase
MVEAVLYNQARLLPVTAYLEGEYGLQDLFIGVPCRLTCQGIEQILELDLTGTEVAALQAAAGAVKQNCDRLEELLR